MATDLKGCVEDLRAALAEANESHSVEMCEAALAGSEAELIAFLQSNELWGGSGSIADQAGMDQGRVVRRRIESSLMRLGRNQMKAGVLNARTRMWVNAFQAWQDGGI